ncbi:MAG: NYN domain-containing protein [Candidatus Eisenbacteria bacterium]|uniref:NYN domain-containing protein n=1 Tax=Eiseniibacteriota bacterium TaxID=2212470 RepID=A0A933SEH7_UNCEI|nr:NYN domain-containing protein [Candidatus Eisenbacteria bacterium]
MVKEPWVKRVVAFVDGQNLFHGAREAFGHEVPDYDVLRLARTICGTRHWLLEGVYFYTGMPDPVTRPHWHSWWATRLATMGSRGIRTFTRPIRYRQQSVSLPDGSKISLRVGQEKGIDVRIALDMVRLARAESYDVCLLFSQDQDLSEAVDEIRALARDQERWVRVACAFPLASRSRNRRGVNGTEWIPIDAPTYERCRDPGHSR